MNKTKLDTQDYIDFKSLAISKDANTLENKGILETDAKYSRKFLDAFLSKYATKPTQIIDVARNVIAYGNYKSINANNEEAVVSIDEETIEDLKVFINAIDSINSNTIIFGEYALRINGAKNTQKSTDEEEK